jgi:hypothetical protein
MRHYLTNIYRNIDGKKIRVYWFQTFGIQSLFLSVHFELDQIVHYRLNIAVTFYWPNQPALSASLPCQPACLTTLLVCLPALFVPTTSTLVLFKWNFMSWYALSNLQSIAEKHSLIKKQILNRTLCLLTFHVFALPLIRLPFQAHWIK